MKPQLIEQQEWARERDGALIDVMVFRVPGGIIQEVYADGDRCEHVFSPRPYVLGQLADSTTETCIFALFYDYCTAQELDPAALYAQAYPGSEFPDADERRESTRQAMAEGVSFPLLWDEKAFAGLLDSLSEINNHSLASVLEDRGAP